MKSLLSQTIVFAICSAGLSAFASDITCSSVPGKLGGNVTVSVGQEEGGRASVMFYAQGGIAQFMTKAGPFIAEVKHEPDGSFYTFQDGSGQQNNLAIITTTMGGQLKTTASTGYSLWANRTMICH